MGIFDLIPNAINNTNQAQQTATNFNNAATILSNYYAPQSSSYQSQIAAQIAGQAAAGNEYAARSSSLFDDLDTKLGQINLDRAGIGISKAANDRQYGILLGQQGFADARYAGDQSYMRNAQQLALSNHFFNTRNTDFQRQQYQAAYNTARRNAISDQTARGATISAGAKADLADILLKRQLDEGFTNVQAGKETNDFKSQIASLDNQIANSTWDYKADQLNRSGQAAGIGDANSRLNLDLVNAALQQQGATKNASTQAQILAAQKAAQDAQAKAALEQLNLQKIALWQQIVAQANAAAQQQGVGGGG